ncbi:7-cyano-7-deazaguanine synthase [Lutimonas halocynthiae]|uniref:7-cyano-7-deazaguanine synthase n=1 Tax=Lutimonas halocynthiae TaxID=1446477 RepID=UPI0025B5CA60|nr:7-cyano-7-deazaguanine synthase [Lutimonas halocynthiae]MDN3643966.1 7-cyano-7-deazaguanine synthase [Lutimonas halocynthiae]
MENKKVNLLWTGGWDSTFQLLQLLLIYKCEVSPYYLIHEKRPSTGKEIRVMKQIKNYLFLNHPFTAELLKPTQYNAVGDIPPNSEISDAYRSILNKYHVGTQYEWLARFCCSKNITQMQLSVQDHENPDPSHFNLKPLLKKAMIGGQESFIIDPIHMALDDFRIFKYFTFPLMELTKIKMRKISNDLGWQDIMNMTWFCHYPTQNEKPCGICRPCIVALDESFGWRIPASRRAVSFYYRKVFWPAKLGLRSQLINVGLFKGKKRDPLA